MVLIVTIAHRMAGKSTSRQQLLQQGHGRRRLWQERERRIQQEEVERQRLWQEREDERQRLWQEGERRIQQEEDEMDVAEQEIHVDAAAEHEAVMAAADLAALQLPGHWAAHRPEPPAPPDEPEPEPGANSQRLFDLIGYKGVQRHTRPLHPDTT